MVFLPGAQSRQLGIGMDFAEQLATKPRASPLNLQVPVHPLDFVGRSMNRGGSRYRSNRRLDTGAKIRTGCIDNPHV